jgi:O-antigen ligase
MMVKKRVIRDSHTHIKTIRAISFVAMGGSLAVSTSFFDPFNFIKSVWIIVGSLLLLGHLAPNLKLQFLLRGRKLQSTILVFLIFILCIATRGVISPDKNSAFFGLFGRQSGILIYAAYFILFSLTAILLNWQNFTTMFLIFNSTIWIVAGYSFFQFTGNDPLDWESLYEGTSSFLGNPNFSGALLSIGAVAGVWLLIFGMDGRLKTLGALQTLVSVFGVYSSKALQGAVSVGIGVLIIVFARFFLIHKRRTIAAGGLLAPGLVAVGFGLFGHGPLSVYLYGSSVAERGDMWRAAFGMIKSNPLFGVGIEQYGSNFRRYRDLKQILRNGPDITSDNAHNIFLHWAATGGVIIGLLFVVIVLAVLIIGLNSLNDLTGQSRNYQILLLAMWIPMQLQSLITVETPGVYVWSWIFAGGILGLALPARISQADNSIRVKRTVRQFPEVKKGNRYTQVITLSLSVILAIFLFRGPLLTQLNFKDGFYLNIDTNSTLEVSQKREELLKAEKFDARNAIWPRLSSNSFFQDGQWAETISAANRAIQINQNDWESWWFKATALENSGNYAEALVPRLKTIESDPLNTSLLLEFAKDQLATGDKVGFEKTKAKIISINPGAPEISQIANLSE